MDWNPYWFNYPLRDFGLLHKPEYKLIVLVLAVEFMQGKGKRTADYAEFLGWSASTFSKWAETASELGLLEVKTKSRGWYTWKTYHLPKEQ